MPNDWMTQRAERGNYNPVYFQDLVLKMRQAQKAYFKTRSKEDLIKSKQLEKQVDDWLKED